MKEITMKDIEAIEKESAERKSEAEIQYRVGDHAPHEVVGYLVGYEEFIDYASGENHWDHVSKMVFSEKAAKDWLKANPRTSEYREQWTNGFYSIVFWDGTVGRRVYADDNGEADVNRR